MAHEALGTSRSPAISRRICPDVDLFQLVARPDFPDLSQNSAIRLLPAGLSGQPFPLSPMGDFIEANNSAKLPRNMLSTFPLNPTGDFIEAVRGWWNGADLGRYFP